MRTVLHTEPTTSILADLEEALLVAETECEQARVEWLLAGTDDEIAQVGLSTRYRTLGGVATGIGRAIDIVIGGRA